MTQQFYRKAAICAILACTTLSVGQTKVKPRTGPRAISVFEKDDKGNARLVPVTILYYDKYYDAAQYQANPVPMALEPGNVYEILEANLPIGFFTLDQPKQVRGNWVAAGTWSAKKAEPESKPDKVEVSVKGGDDDDRPVLKRHGEKESKPSEPDDPDRPTLKKPDAPKENTKDNTSDAPTLTKRSATPVDTDLSRDTNESDPDRPVLRKTVPGANPTNGLLEIPTGPTRAAAPAKIAPEASAEHLTQYVAISDAQKTDYRPFAYDLKDEEKKSFAAKMQKIAAFNLQKWALAHGGVKLPATLSFTDFEVRAFDVDYSNNAEVIFTASYTPSGATPAPTKKPGVRSTPAQSAPPAKAVTYYLTLVARGDANLDMNPIFSQITDSTRLDAYARLELVDAVDPDGYGRGSLLFREYTDSGKAFVLYRVDPYNLTKLFEGASGE